MYVWKSWGKSNFWDIRIKMYYIVISILIGIVCFIPLNNYWSCSDIYTPFYTILLGLTAANFKWISVVTTFFLVERGLISSFRWYIFKNQILYYSDFLWHVLSWQCPARPIDMQIERQHMGAPDCVEMFKSLVAQWVPVTYFIKFFSATLHQLPTSNQPLFLSFACKLSCTLCQTFLPLVPKNCWVYPAWLCFLPYSSTSDSKKHSLAIQVT